MRKTLILSAFLLLFLVPVLATNGVRLLEGIAADQLENLGIINAKLSIAELSFEKVTFSGVSLGKNLSIPSLNASFNWQELLSGNIETIQIEDLSLEITKLEDRFSFGELDPLIFSSDTTTQTGSAPDTIDWPIDNLDLKNAQIRINTGHEIIFITFDGALHKDKSDIISISAPSISIKHPSLSTKGKADIKLSPNGGLSGSLQLHDGKLNISPIKGEFDFGEIQISGNLNDLSSLSGGARIDISHFMLLPGLDLSAQLSASLKKEQLKMDFLIPENSTGIEGVLSLQTSLKNQERFLTFYTALESKDLSQLPPSFPHPKDLKGQAKFSAYFKQPLDEVKALIQEKEKWDILHHLPPLSFEIETQNLSISNDFFTSNIRGIWELKGDGDALNIHERTPLSLQLLESPKRKYPSTFQKIYNPLHKTDLSISLSEENGPLLSLRQDNSDLILKTSSKIAFQGGGLSPSVGKIKASMKISAEDFSINSFALDNFTFTSSNWLIDKTHLLSPTFNLQIKGTPKSYHGMLALESQMTGYPHEAIEIENASLKMAAILSGTDENIQMSLPDCAQLNLAKVRILGNKATFLSPPLCLTSDQKDLFQFDFSDPSKRQKAQHYLRIKLPSKPLRFTLENGHRLSIGGTGSSLLFKGETQIGSTKAQADGTWELDSYFRHIISSDLKILAKDVTLNSLGKIKDKYLKTQLKIGKISHLQLQPYFTDLSASFDATLENQRLSFTGQTNFLNHVMQSEFEGHYNIPTQSGRGVIRPFPVTFSKERHALDEISPFAAQYFKSFKGSLLAAIGFDLGPQKACLRTDINFKKYRLETSSNAHMISQPLHIDGGQIASIIKACRKNGKNTSSASLLIENANSAYGLLKAQKINTLIKLSTLSPVQTQGEQLISIGALNIGIPIQNGIIKFDFSSPEKIHIKNISFNMAQGNIYTPPFDIINSEITSPLTLKVDGVQLEELLASINVSGISGTGILDGTLPIYMNDKRLKIKKGVLKSRNGGILRYIRDTQDEGVTALIYDALRNFHYERLRLELDESKNETLSIRLKAKGGNPDFFDGYPVELDIGLHGNLDAILKDSLSAYQVPDTIRKRMLKYGK